jgi:hypothetical protein
MLLARRDTSGTAIRSADFGAYACTILRGSPKTLNPKPEALNPKP